MCQGDKNCKSCTSGCGSSNADGEATYNPAEIAAIINTQILDGAGTAEQVQDAYVKVMVWLEDKKLAPTQENISSNKDEIKVIVNDPNFLVEKEGEKAGYKMFVVLAAVILLGWWCFKS